MVVRGQRLGEGDADGAARRYRAVARLSWAGRVRGRVPVPERARAEQTARATDGHAHRRLAGAGRASARRVRRQLRLRRDVAERRPVRPLENPAEHLARPLAITLVQVPVPDAVAIRRDLHGIRVLDVE